jgi:hypothetical protein
MILERTAVYNIYGLTAIEKGLIYNALDVYKKRFGESDTHYGDLSALMKKIEPTDEVPMMKRDTEKVAVAAAYSEDKNNG